MRLLQGHVNSVQALAYSPDGATLASASDDGAVRLWDAATGAPRAVLRDRPHNAVLCVAFAGPETVASCGFDGWVLCWDRETGKSRPLTRFAYPATALAVVGDGEVAAAGADCGRRRSMARPTLRVVTRARGELERRWFTDGWPAVWSVALSPDGTVLAAGLARGEVVLWRLPSGERMGRLSTPYAVQGLAFAPDGKTLAALTGPEVHLWDGAGQLLRVLGGERHRVCSAAFSPDGRTLATGCWDSAVRLWDLRTGAERRRYDWRLGRINAVAVAPDGLTAAAAGNGRDIFIWDLDE